MLLQVLDHGYVKVNICCSNVWMFHIVLMWKVHQHVQSRPFTTTFLKDRSFGME